MTSNAADRQSRYDAIIAGLATDISASELRGLLAARRRLADEGFVPALGKPIRVAVAGSATSSFVAPALLLALEGRGIAAEIHEVGFGNLEAALHQPDSGLAAFRPDILITLQTPLAISDWPAELGSNDVAQSYAEERINRVLELATIANQKWGCSVVSDNFHLLAARPHGSVARRMPAERNSIIQRLNSQLDVRRQSWLYIHDVAGLAANHGLRRWVDMRFWFAAKQPMSFACLPAYVRSLASLVAAIVRTPAKCVVLDLDNTLWGGVVGDDGVSGIKIGQGDALGEAFLFFQQHLLRMKQRGLLLAVCSKNEIENAEAPFRELPDMALRLTDFVSFQANWMPKPDNIRAIARELNIGVDALVFVDDNPAERAHVRKELPEVKVIDLPDDPAGYPDALDSSGLFEFTTISSEDSSRTEAYRENAQRAALATQSGDYDEFLMSLQQQASVSTFSSNDLDRITQLINKTNQFNLTTQRITRSQLEQLAGDPAVVTIQIRLSDRFGDNGLIGVLYGTVASSTLHIDQWLMSCRVFNRGVEKLTMNYLVEKARAVGAATITGEYRPTPKNGLVRDLYRQMGFSPLGSPPTDDTGAELWTLSVDSYEPQPHSIAVTRVAEQSS